MELSTISATKDIADIVAAGFTVLAIIVGGGWGYVLFVRKRQKYPRANTKHEITHLQIADGKLLLHVDVTISNVGDVLISLVSGIIRIQQILSPSPELMDAIKERGDPVKEGSREIEWPLIVERPSAWASGEFEIEPGESEQIPYDFIINADVQTVEVYSYYKNTEKPKREIGWNLTTIHKCGG